MKTVGIITGILMGILGVYALFVPFKTFLGIGWALGILIFINGIELMVMAFSAKKKDIWKALLGLLEIIAGVVLLVSGVQRFLTDILAVYLIGTGIAVYGIYQIIHACGKLKEEKGFSIFMIVCGILSIIVALLAVGHPVLTMVSVGYLIAIALIMRAIDIITLAWNIKSEKE